MDPKKRWEMNNKKQNSYQSRQLTGHQKLERRRLLNADFGFAGGELTLFNFDNSDDGVANQIQIEEVGNTYQVILSEGNWSTADSTTPVTGAGSNTLTLDNTGGILSSILAQSTTADSFDIQFGGMMGGFDFDGDVTIEQSDGANFGSITQQAGSSFTQTGTLDITAADVVNLSETSNDFDIVNIEDATTITLADANDLDTTAITATGDVVTTAGGNITLNGAVVGGELTAITTSGDINVNATGDLDLATIDTDDGSAEVNTTGDVQIGSVTVDAATPADGTVDINTTGGSINDLQDDNVADVTAAGTIQLNAADEIGGMPITGLVNDADGRLEFASDSVLEITADNGDVALRGLGDITLQDVEVTLGSVDVLAAGDVLVGSVIADTTVDVVTTGGSINDQQDDLDADFVAGGLVTLAANDEIGGNVSAGMVADADGKLEIEDAVDLAATAGDDIALRGLGEINLQDIEATAGAVDVMAAGDVQVGEVTADSTIDILTTGGSINDLQDDLTADLTAGGLVTLTAADEIGGNVAAGMVADADGKLDFADESVVDAESTTGDIALRGLGDITLEDVEATVGAVDIMAAGDVLVGEVQAGTTIDIMAGGSINDLEDDLIADFVAGGTVTLSAEDEIGGIPLAGTATDAGGKLELGDGVVVDATTTTGDIAIGGTGSLTISNAQATAGTVNVIAQDDIQVLEISAADGVFVGAGEDGTGAITLDGDVTTTSAAGRTLLQSAGAVVQNSGAITTNGLILEGADYTLGGNNVVDILAANVSGGLTFANDAALVFGGLMFSSTCITSTVTGVTAASLDVAADGLTQTEAVNVSGTANFTVTDEICLKDPTNDFGGTVTATGATIEIVDINDLIVGTLTATDNVYLSLELGAVAC